VFVATHRHHGVVPICRVLSTSERPIAPSAVRSALARPVTARQVADEAVKPKLLEVFDANYRVYGRRKMKAALRREHGINLDKDRIARLMRELGIRGATRSKTAITTRSNKTSSRAPDLVNRRFHAERPNQLWVCDFTYVPTWSGFAYTAFVVDVYSRRIVGWRTAATMTADLVTDALNMAIFSRRHQLIDGVIAHSDAGSQYVSLAYTERLAEIGAQPSIGSVGDSYDNAMAESVIGLYKTELIRPQGPWRQADHVELATLTYIDWFNQRRLHSELDDLPPAEFEAAYYARTRATAKVNTPTRT
jgi:putative transposase